MSIRDEVSLLFDDRVAFRILFVPWLLGFTTAHDEAKRWSEADKKMFVWLAYDGEENWLMKRVGSLDVVYLLGHGAPGEPRLWPEASLSGTFLSVEDLCRRLIRSGLPPNWRGHLKCYSCFSATGITRSGAEPKLPFAMQMASYARSQGYSWRVFGYAGIPTSNGAGRQRNAYSINDEHLGRASQIRSWF